MSKPYMISYDLNDPGQKYEDVKKTIEDFSICARRVQKPFWLVRSEFTPEEMVRKLEKNADLNDTILIFEIKNHYFGQAFKEDWNFIQNSLFPD